MNVVDLRRALDMTSVTGRTLSSAEIHDVRNTLLSLRVEHHLKDIFFMGKIFGVKGDYYVAFGSRSDETGGRLFYYSTNKTDWFVLSEPSPCALKLTPRVTQRFTGSPSHIIDWRGAGDTFGMSGRECVLKEEDRLATVACHLLENCAIAPKGAFFQNDDGLMEINPAFQGLSIQQGSDAKWWIHIQKRGQSHPCSSGDCGALTGDWSFRLRAQGSACVVLNLEWLGFTVYHRLRTPEHGFVYFGDGMKVKNLVSSEN